MVSVPKAPKRQPWDLKGRLEDMENLLRATQGRVGTLEEQKTTLTTQVEQKETVVQQSTEELDSLRAQLDQSRKERRELNAELEDERDKSKNHLRKIEDLEFSKSSLERKIQGLEGEIFWCCTKQLNTYPKILKQGWKILKLSESGITPMQPL